MAIDLYRCPVASVPQYRETLFASLPALEILDHTNKKGEDASLSDDQDEDEEVSEQDDEERQIAEEILDDEELEGDDASEEESSPQKRPKN